MRIAVVCTGSVKKGLGHLFRSASFAQVAEQVNEVQIIAQTDAKFASIFHELSSVLIVVESEQQLASELIRFAPDLTVIDMIEIGDEAFFSIRQASPLLACISPIFSHAAKTDLFITRGQAPAGLSGPKIYSGTQYTIINAHCTPINDFQFESAVSARALPIMLSFGGADADNHSRLLLETLGQIKLPMLFWLMLGDGYEHSHDELVKTIKSFPNHEIIMARTNRSMWGVATNCALAILTSGLSTIEAIYAGLPVISMHRANDPSRQIKTSYEELCLSGGSFNDGTYLEVCDLVTELHLNRQNLRAMREKQSGVVDGLGVQRVVELIQNFAHETPTETPK